MQSNENSVEHLTPAEFPDLSQLQIDSSLYEGARVSLDGTTFILLGRKKDGIGVDRLYEGLKTTWPKWMSYFPVQLPTVTILEADWGLGGGSLGPFMVGVYLRGAYDSTASGYLKTILGWDLQPTGRAYVEKAFENFEDPMQAYVTDQIAHELGHVFFLHGLLDLKTDVDTWFALGLGIVYDRLVWREVSAKPSPVFDAFVRVWKENYSKNPNIDQRLIHPNTERDEEFGLVRLQTYDHGKAYVYLDELRTRVGAEKFDSYVRGYLQRPVGSSIEYDEFLSSFTPADLQIVKTLENEFVVR